MTDLLIYKVAHHVDVAMMVGGFSKGTNTPFDYHWGLNYYTKGPVAHDWTKHLATKKNFEIEGVSAAFDGNSLYVGTRIVPTGYCVLTKAVMFQSGKGRCGHKKETTNLSEELARPTYWIVCDVMKLFDQQQPKVVWYQIHSDLLYSLAEAGLLTTRGWSRKEFFCNVREWRAIAV